MKAQRDNALGVAELPEGEPVAAGFAEEVAVGGMPGDIARPALNGSHLPHRPEVSQSVGREDGLILHQARRFTRGFGTKTAH